MQLSLQGKRALVCGSTQGIGRACAMGLAAAGAEVTLLARHPEALERVRGELPIAYGQRHATIEADFSRWKDVRERAMHAAERSGGFHVLVNNTGGPPAGLAVEAAVEDFEQAFAQHLLCAQGLVQSTVPGMKNAGFGRIVNIISTSVVTPIRGLGVSNTIRGAMANWGRTLAAELAPLGITVNNVLPGYTRTARLESLMKGRASRAGSTFEDIERDMMNAVPMKRFGTVDEIAAAVVFLCSPAASYITGVNLPVDGGRVAAQ